MSKKKHHRKIKKLRTRLEKAEASKAKWKTKAKRLEAKLKKSAAEVAKRSKQVTELREDQKQRSIAPDAAGDPAPEPDTATPLTAPELPDESWTVTRLRATAREAGVPGYSRMSKAALLDALKQPSTE